jgi:hypothetical protein
MTSGLSSSHPKKLINISCFLEGNYPYRKIYLPSYCGILDFDTISSGKLIPTFQKKMLPSSGLYKIYGNTEDGTSMFLNGIQQ